MAWVYILICRDDSYYTGSTRDLLHRFGEHARGEGPAHPRRRRPVKLAWAQEFEREDDAYIVEHQIKGWRREKKAALIEGRVGWLQRLSRMGVKAKEAPLTAEVRRRIESDSARLRAGQAVESSTVGFEAAPLDAVTKQGSQMWLPRSQRFHRMREQQGDR